MGQKIYAKKNAVRGSKNKNAFHLANSPPNKKEAKE